MPEQIRTIDPDTATAAFRILQESLTNVLRHAKATQVNVVLRLDAGRLILRVEDNGCGMPKDRMHGPLSIGLIGMRERALLLGGQLEVRSQLGGGTMVEMRVPLAECTALGGKAP